MTKQEFKQNILDGYLECVSEYGDEYLERLFNTKKEAEDEAETISSVFKELDPETTTYVTTYKCEKQYGLTIRHRQLKG